MTTTYQRLDEKHRWELKFDGNVTWARLQRKFWWFMWIDILTMRYEVFDWLRKKRILKHIEEWPKSSFHLQERLDYKWELVKQMIQDADTRNRQEDTAA